MRAFRDVSEKTYIREKLPFPDGMIKLGSIGTQLPDDSGNRRYFAELPDDSGDFHFTAELPDDSGEF